MIHLRRFCLLSILSLLTFSAAKAEDKKFDFDLYGFVRTDFFYDSRVSMAPCNELFYMYPLDESLDALGEDMNDYSTLGFYSFITRLGLNITGPNIGKATSFAKVEIDFGGYGSMNTLLRIRQAYLNLNWDSKHNLIMGQTWHPLFGTVMPSLTNISTGSPFQPFNRSPQFRYEFTTNRWTFLTATMSQMQYTSNGPDGMSNTYSVKSCIPEMYWGFDYRHNGWQFGGGFDMLHLRPRTESVYDGLTYKVDELMRSFTGEVHMRYTKGTFNLGAKTLVGSALDYLLMIGGYGVTASTGDSIEREYTPLRHSASWITATYGTKWKPTIYVGYTKNLGSGESLYSADDAYLYGFGTNIDQLFGATIGLTYNLPAFSVGVEYSSTTAWYGDVNLSSGRVQNTHDVTNHRISAMASYIF